MTIAGFAGPTPVAAHGGGLDAYGCHNDRKAGTYHCHPQSHSASTVTVEQGDLSPSGGSPTIRQPFERWEDDPATTNDESNDQPRGHFGTVTLSARSIEAGNCYTLDGDVSRTELHRLYFLRGGWIDFIGCDLDDDLSGECDDEEGRPWELQGER